MGQLINPYRYRAADLAVISATVTYLGTGTSFNIPIPATAQENDLLIMCVGHGFAPNLPAGWTDRHYTTPLNVNARTFSKTCAAGEPGTNQVITVSSSYAGSAVLFVVRGGNWGTMTAITGSSHTAGTLYGPADAAATVGDLALYFAHFRPSGVLTLEHGTTDSAASGSNATGKSGHETVASTAWSTRFSNNTAGNGYYITNIIVTP